jgi:protein-tyrosine phosphatase
VLIALVDAAIALLAQGINLYVHCQMGISRSTYFNTALYMRLGMTLKEAVAHIKKHRSVAWPNWGFYDHLQKLEPRLHDR